MLVDTELRANEEVINYLEEKIPELAKLAIQQAYWKALISGSSVLIAKNNILVAVFPDGSEKIIKQLEPGRRVKAGQIWEAKC